MTYCLETRSMRSFGISEVDSTSRFNTSTYRRCYFLSAQKCPMSITLPPCGPDPRRGKGQERVASRCQVSAFLLPLHTRAYIPRISLQLRTQPPQKESCLRPSLSSVDFWNSLK